MGHARLVFFISGAVAFLVLTSIAGVDAQKISTREFWDEWGLAGILLCVLSIVVACVATALYGVWHRRSMADGGYLLSKKQRDEIDANLKWPDKQ